MGTVQTIVSVLPNISDDTSMTNILLYKSTALTSTRNKEILNATLEYIQNTGRLRTKYLSLFRTSKSDVRNMASFKETVPRFQV